jgi:hypothetical protein
VTTAGWILAAVLIGLPSCDDGGGSELVAQECGLPTPEPDVDASLVPDAFLVDETEVVKVFKGKDRFTAALNIQKSVNDSFELYRKAAGDAGFDLVGVDNEGFEAEVYMKRGTELGTVQIRTSTCDDASVVFVNIVQT